MEQVERGVGQVAARWGEGASARRERAPAASGARIAVASSEGASASPRRTQRSRSSRTVTTATIPADAYGQQEHRSERSAGRPRPRRAARAGRRTAAPRARPREAGPAARTPCRGALPRTRNAASCAASTLERTGRHHADVERADRRDGGKERHHDGLSAALLMSHADVAASPIAAPAAPTPASTARTCAR